MPHIFFSILSPSFLSPTFFDNLFSAGLFQDKELVRSYSTLELCLCVGSTEVQSVYTYLVKSRNLTSAQPVTMYKAFELSSQKLHESYAV